MSSPSHFYRPSPVFTGELPPLAPRPESMDEFIRFKPTSATMNRETYLRRVGDLTQLGYTPMTKICGVTMDRGWVLFKTEPKRAGVIPMIRTSVFGSPNDEELMAENSMLFEAIGAAIAEEQKRRDSEKPKDPAKSRTTRRITPWPFPRLCQAPESEDN